MGGSDAPDNIIELSIEEHAEAHKKLYEDHGRWEDRLAWKGLAGQMGKDEILLEIYRENQKKVAIFNKGKSPPNKGVSMKEEQRQKLLGPKTEEHKQNMRKPKSDTEKMGKYERTSEMRLESKRKVKELFATPEMKKRLSDAQKKSRGTCEWCNMETNKANLTRHIKICKKKPADI
jgi:hypothetical protein